MYSSVNIAYFTFNLDIAVTWFINNESVNHCDDYIEQFLLNVNKHDDDDDTSNLKIINKKTFLCSLYLVISYAKLLTGSTKSALKNSKQRIGKKCCHPHDPHCHTRPPNKMAIQLAHHHPHTEVKYVTSKLGPTSGVNVNRGFMKHRITKYLYCAECVY